MTEFIKPLPPGLTPKVKRVKHAFESQDAKYPQKVGPPIPRRDAAPPPVSESGNQVGGPAEQENDNEVKVNARHTLKELLLSGYTHADVVAAMKEVYGEVKEKKIEEREDEEEEVEEKEVEEQEIEGREAGEEEVEERERLRNKRLKKERLRQKKLKRERSKKKKFKAERLRKKKLKAKWLRKKEWKRERLEQE
ncbi:unnamed protein product [Lactuca saligna]|uniref:Uncharacterized protein n=1 Tax=Lactuca saligna TaxID=75948 RepID=A0AA35ZK48_LACSI|nr:unnamed protein product [Lactuca saligna]